MVILASNSELRKLILERAGIVFEVIPGTVDERAIERQNPDKTAAEVVELLAIAKAEEVAMNHAEDLVIAADTFAVLPNGERLHKTDIPEASLQRALEQSGVTVTVHTGVAMLYKNKLHTNRTLTKITYQKFDKETLRHLSMQAQSKRRNAALGFFVDAPGFTLVEKIEGSYMGAMGLPMDVIRNGLKELGYTENLHSKA